MGSEASVNGLTKKWQPNINDIVKLFGVYEVEVVAFDSGLAICKHPEGQISNEAAYRAYELKHMTLVAPASEAFSHTELFSKHMKSCPECFKKGVASCERGHILQTATAYDMAP